MWQSLLYLFTYDYKWTLKELNPHRKNYDNELIKIWQKFLWQWNLASKNNESITRHILFIASDDAVSVNKVTEFVFPVRKCLFLYASGENTCTCCGKMVELGIYRRYYFLKKGEHDLEGIKSNLLSKNVFNSTGSDTSHQDRQEHFDEIMPRCVSLDYFIKYLWYMDWSSFIILQHKSCSTVVSYNRSINIP